MSTRWWSAALSALGTVVLVGLMSSWLVAGAARADDLNATMTLTPTSGTAATQISAVFHVTIQCPGTPATFTWDGVALGQPQPVDVNCRASRTISAPAQGQAPGPHALCAHIEPAQLANACATFTVKLPNTPTPPLTGTPTAAPPSPTAAATPAATPDSFLPPPGSGFDPPRLARQAPAPVGGEWVVALVAGLGLGLAAGVGFTLRPAGDGWSWPRGAAAATTALIGLAATTYLTGMTSSPVSVQLDDSRVTQGLELDVSDKAGVFYDGIAGKDTLARADLRITNLA